MVVMEIREVTIKSGHKACAKIYDGVTYPMMIPGNVSDQLEKINQLEYFPDDTLVLSYQKSGTHWVMEIVNMIRTGKAEYHERLNIAFEYYDPERIVNVPVPRTYGSHLRPRHLPKPFIQNKRKIVYVYRNPKDIVVSMFSFYRKLTWVSFEGTWDAFFDMWLNKNVIDSWFDYVKDVAKFIKENPDYPILVVSYENMKKNLLKEVKRIAEFLEPDTSDELCEEIARKCEFSMMNKAKNNNVPDDVKNMSSDGSHMFYRKGDVGDWKNWFTVSMNETFDEIYKDKMKDFDLDVQFTLD